MRLLDIPSGSVVSWLLERSLWVDVSRQTYRQKTGDARVLFVHFGHERANERLFSIRVKVLTESDSLKPSERV